MNRMRWVVSKVNKRLTIQSAAILLAGSTLISSFLGLYRDRILNSMYYDTYKVGLDAYVYAFQVPDFMFFILVSGALSVTFIPVFNQRLATGNKKSAWQLSSSLINFMALTTLVASILIIIFAEPLIGLIANGLDESGRELAISLMRVIAVNPFLFAIATVIASMQQAIGRFTFFALAPTIYNIGIIIGALFFTNGISLFGVQIFEGGIMGVALGVVLGSIMQLIVSSIGLLGLGFDYQFKIRWKNKGFRKVLGLLPARSLDQGMDYFVSLFELRLASHMESGVARAYQQALALHMMPVNLVGVAISTAAFPSMTEHLGSGNVSRFRQELQQILRVIVWLALPIAIITYFTRGFVVSFVKNGGDSLMAGILGALVVAILFRTIYHIAARSFYAQQDTKTPLYISLFSIALNIGLALWFTQSLKMGAYGLAFAQSIVAFVEVVILFGIMQLRIEGGIFDRRMVQGLVKMAVASGLMAFITYGMVQLFQLQSNDMSLSQTLPKFLLIVAVSAIFYVWLGTRLRLGEAHTVSEKMKKIAFSRRV
ncbi:MAG TPA: murein biosynthesis integral membrane protein MurJ [Candidatus Saccharibacteria bacterium]|nr:murein biosynthesis integral membrane protein MurJ [Candidatus Saccharibacteria bacterium]HMR38588.1 murein biosynthesis integral membrane protein MurJ [Candidatus Saccharibacteria bacterium]